MNEVFISKLKTKEKKRFTLPNNSSEDHKVTQSIKTGKQKGQEMHWEEEKGNGH